MKEWLLIGALYVLGRMASLVVYQMTWSAGKQKKYPLGSSTLGLMRHPIIALFCGIISLLTFSLQWSQLPELQVISVVISLLLSIAAVGRWGAANLRSNFIFDRAILLLFAIGVWWKPCFLLPCLMFSCALQYTVSPFRLGSGYSNLLGFEFVRSSACLLMIAFAYVGVLEILSSSFHGFDGLVFTSLLMMQSANYVSHGLAKSALGKRWNSWINENRLEYLLGNAWLRGWWSSREENDVMAQMKWLGKHRSCLGFCVWLLEISWIFLLIDHRLAVLLLVCTIVFHVIILLMTGLMCYHYVINHVCLIYLISSGTFDRFFGTNLLLCVVLIPATTWWIGKVRLAVLHEFQTYGEPKKMGRWIDAADHLMAWWDTPMMRIYSYQVITASGKIYSFPVNKLSPYDTTLTDLPTHVMILGVNQEFDSSAATHQKIARIGVWGLTIYDQDRDHLYSLFEKSDDEIRRVLRYPVIPQPWQALPECVYDLRDLFMGINEMMMDRHLRFILRWPHFPGEDLVPDRCPLMKNDHPSFAFDEKIVSVKVQTVRTFINQDRIILLDVFDLGDITIPTQFNES